MAESNVCYRNAVGGLREGVGVTVGRMTHIGEGITTSGRQGYQ